MQKDYRDEEFIMPDPESSFVERYENMQDAQEAFDPSWDWVIPALVIAALICATVLIAS